MRFLICSFLLLFTCSANELWACGPPSVTNAEATTFISAPLSVCPGETVDVVITSDVNKSQPQLPNSLIAFLPPNLTFSFAFAPNFFFNNVFQAWPSTVIVNTNTTPQTVQINYSSPADLHGCVFGFRAIAAQSGSGTISVSHLDQGVNIGSNSQSISIRNTNPQLSIAGPTVICEGTLFNDFAIQANTAGAFVSNVSWSINPSSLILQPSGAGVIVSVPNGNYSGFSLNASGNVTVCGVTNSFNLTTYGQIVESGGSCSFQSTAPTVTIAQDIDEDEDASYELSVRPERVDATNDLSAKSTIAFGEQLAYPNPANDRLSIPANCTESETTITLVNVEGKELLQGSAEAGMPTTLDVSAIPAGIYLLQQRSKCGYLAQKISIE